MFTLDLSSNSKFEEDISELFNKICYDNRQNFNYLIEKLSQNFYHKLDYWVSSPASRNTLNSTLFLDFCKVKLVEELIKKEIQPNSIIIDSKALRKVISQISGIYKTKIIYKNPNTLSSLKNLIIVAILPIIIFLERSFKLIVFNKFIKQKIIIPKSPITLIDTYALPGFYSKDRYYNGLLTSLNDDEKKYIYFFPTIIMTKWTKILSVYKELLNSDRKFIFKEFFLSYSDIIYASIYPIRVRFIKSKSLIIDGIDYSSLVNAEMRNRNGYDLAIEGLINYRFIRRLKEKKIKIKKVIDWWESQALDKGLHKALSDFYPKINTVGYLGYAPRNLELQLFPTKYEKANGVVPKNIAVIGKGFTKAIKTFNCDQKVECAPAFRFRHLWEKTDRIFQDTFTVLIALPITFNDSKNIIEKMIYFANNRSENGIKYWVKPHPTMSPIKLKNEFGNKWPKSFNFTDIDTQSALRRINLVISGMSSLCLEAMALGIPVLVIDQEVGIQYNPIPDNLNQDLWKRCNSIQDIINGFEKYRLRDENEIKRHQKLGLNIREKYFEPINKDGVLKLLSIKGISNFE